MYPFQVIHINAIASVLCGYGVEIIRLQMNEDYFINTLIGVITKVPALILVILLNLYLGRKTTLIMCQILLGLTTIFAGLVVSNIVAIVDSSPSYFILMLMFRCIGELGSSPLLYLYAAEILPTVVRAKIFTSYFMVNCLVVLLVTLFGFHESSGETVYIPLTIFGIGALMGGTTAMMKLPGTKGLDLPETIKDAENLKRKLDRSEVEVGLEENTPALNSNPQQHQDRVEVGLDLEEGTPDLQSIPQQSNRLEAVENLVNLQAVELVNLRNRVEMIEDSNEADEDEDDIVQNCAAF